MQNNQNYGPAYNGQQGYGPHQQYGPQQQPKKKHSGARETPMKNGNTKGGVSLHAWNYSKSRGMLTLKAFQNSRSVETQGTKNPNNHFVTLMCEVFYNRTGNTVLELISYNKTTGKAKLEKLNMIISTKAPNGGYFGQAQKK